VLAGGIAHDFNNLLGSIFAEAELGEAEVADGSAPVEELRTIKGIAIRAGEIVRELMIYAGHDDAILDLLDLSQLVGEMLALLRISISKHVTLKVDLPENLPTIRANASHLRQVFLRLGPVGFPPHIAVHQPFGSLLPVPLPDALHLSITNSQNLSRVPQPQIPLLHSRHHLDALSFLVAHPYPSQS
jgi:hypothetical protein